MARPRHGPTGAGTAIDTHTPGVAPIEADAVIIGAGPSGLFQVFELGLLDVGAHVIETLDRPGGQCTELYPSKPIYDIPACPAIGAQELVDRLMEQIAPFGATFHLSQQVTALERLDDERFFLETTAGTRFVARSVVVAGGVGSFAPVTLKAPGAETHAGHRLHYSVRDPERFAGRDLVIVGGGDSALDWTLDLVGRAGSVLLVHRSERFRAAPASVSRMRALCDAFEMQFLVGEVTRLVDGPAGADGAPSLAAVEVTGGDGVARRVDLDELLVFFGLSPKLGPIAEWGLDLKGKQIRVDTARFESSVAGVFAVGDVNAYPGKKKLILSGFHEAALAAFAIKERLNPGRKVHLQYTTTSPVMHERLGVDDPYAEETGEAA